MAEVHDGVFYSEKCCLMIRLGVECCDTHYPLEDYYDLEEEDNSDDGQ